MIKHSHQFIYYFLLIVSGELWLHSLGVKCFDNDILFSIERVLNKKIKVKYSKSRSFDVRENVLDVKLASQEFNWRPEIMLEDGIKRLANHFTSKSI